MDTNLKCGIQCPKCLGDTHVRRTRRELGFIYRVRLCKNCQYKIKTKEK
jgi:hypothetical protein